MKSKSIKGKSLEDIQLALEHSMADQFKPSLAIIFLSIQQDLGAISKLLDEKDIQVFGATTAGEFIDGDIEEGSIVMLLMDMDPAYFQVEFLEVDPQTALEDSKKLGEISKKLFQNPALIIASGGIYLDGDLIMEGILQGLEIVHSSASNEISIFGGMAGDDLLTERPTVFTNGKSKDNALVALIIDKDKIDVRGIATCGWEAIGTSKTVTKSEGNIVYTIDDKPALDMLTKYLGVELKKDGDQSVVAFQNSWYYPLQLERENGDTVIRATRFADSEKRSLICTGSVPQGSKIKFSLPPDFDAIKIVVEECESIKDNAEQEADALIIFSCVSRYLSFGALMKEEIEQVQEVWKAPMAGFFTYGEFGKSKIGDNEFHNNACCAVALKEK